jgi:DNA-directed RNA polymerase subunit RPC12/RpoP
MSAPQTSETAIEQPVEKKLPPAGRKFPCAKCGARLDFDPSSRELKCPYCGHCELIQPSAHQVEEQDWNAYWSRHTGEEKPIAGRASQITCTGCGAVILLQDQVATDKCPYCATHLENQPETAKEMIPPGGLLPFAISQRQAIDAFGQWIAGRWFAPNALRQFANLGQLNGVYVPFWTYASMTDIPVPEGHLKIAQQFIAGKARNQRPCSPVGTTAPSSCWRSVVPTGFGDGWPRSPSDKSLGYFQLPLPGQKATLQSLTA